MSDRGDQDNASDDKCPKCGMMYVADCMTEAPPRYPISADYQVQCFFCDHTGPIKDWWDAFDKT